MDLKKVISGALLVMFFVLAIAGLSATHKETAKTEYSNQEQEEQQELSITTPEQSSDINWASLPEEVVAWVKVPGTSIDEPIAQADSRNPNRYLKRDVLSQGAYGTPYIDSECSLSSPFVIIHGHNNSGDAFSDFAKYADRSYAESHALIELHQRDKDPLYLKVMAVDIVNANNERLEIVQDKPLEDYVSKADIMLENPSEIKQLFAFSTCSYQTKNSRTVVYAIAT